MSETQELPANTPAPEGDAAAENSAPQQQTTPKPEEKKPEGGSWQDRMIASQRSARQAAERERDEARAELERLRSSQPGQEKDPNDPVEIARVTREQVQREERERIEFDRFNQACNATADKIRTEFGDDGLKRAATGWQNAGMDLRQSGHRDLLSLIASVDDGPKLYHDIGNDPEFASRLLEMSPVRAAFELAKRLPAAQAKEIKEEAVAVAEAAGETAAAQTPAPPVAAPRAPAISSAPRPPAQPAASRGSPASSRDIYDPKISPDEFARLRAEQKKAARSN